MWNGHRMLRHRGHRDELTKPTSSQNGGTIIRGILFGCQDSSHRQNISSLSSMIDLLFFLLFIRLIFLFSSLASRGSKPIFCFPFSVFQVFVLVSSAFFSSFSFFFLPLFFVARRLFFDDYTWPKGKRIVRLTTTFFDTRVFCGE